MRCLAVIFVTIKIEAISEGSTTDCNIVVSVSQKIYPIYSYCIEELRPDANFHPNYPAGEYSYALTDNTVKMWEECHEYDLQFETTECHSVQAYKLGYKDDSGFHEFKDYKIYKNSNLTTELKFNTLSEFALNGANDTDKDFNWTGTAYYKTAKVYVVVKDSGYEGTYTGLCYKFNYL